MSDFEELAVEINQMTTKGLQYIVKLVCLMQNCPGFEEDLNRIVPDGQETVTREQFAATDALMETWLYEKGWAKILRTELGSVGVPV